MYPRNSTEAMQLNRCKSEKNRKPALCQRFKSKALFYPVFFLCGPILQDTKGLRFCSGSATAARELQLGPRVLLGPKADRKISSGQLCKRLVFGSGARVLQSAHYKSCGKSDSEEKCLNWSRSPLEVRFSVCHELLYFQILILGYWIFISR